GRQEDPHDPVERAAIAQRQRELAFGLLEEPEERDDLHGHASEEAPCELLDRRHGTPLCDLGAVDFAFMSRSGRRAASAIHNPSRAIGMPRCEPSAIRGIRRAGRAAASPLEAGWGIPTMHAHLRKRMLRTRTYGSVLDAFLRV